MSNAQREALVGELAKVKAEYGGTVELASGFLETMVGREIAPEQFATTLFKIAGDWKTAGEKIDALSFSGNLSPRLSALRDQAKAVHVAGRLDEAEKLLAEIVRAESDALKRLEDHERKILEEIRLRKRGIAETKAAQASVAHARLNYRGAAALYGEAAYLVESFDFEGRRTLLLAQAAELYAQGEEFGDNAALSEAIALYRQCLDLAPRERVPLDWAMTQNESRPCAFEARRAGERDGAARRGRRRLSRSLAGIYPRARAARLGNDHNNLGRALFDLGERESGTARLEEAVAAYRERFKEKTRAGVPLQWAMTQINLGTALLSLGERERGHGAARRGRCRLSRRLAGIDPRARAAPMGHDPDESRHGALKSSASGRGARSGSRRPSPPIARPCRN